MDSSVQVIYEPEETIVEMDSDEDDDDTLVEEVIMPNARVPKVRKPRSANNEMHYCTLCKYSTSKKHLLTAHMKVHSDDRPHKCYLCEKGFKTTAALNSHVNTHTGTKPHPCKECDMAFTTGRELNRHVRYKHTHEKPHKCSLCDYACVESSKLRRHIRTHTGERPYPCTICSFAAADDSALKRHLRTHTGEKPFECQVCNKRFTESYSLKCHMKLHEEGTKTMYQCTICETIVSRIRELNRHFQNFHVAGEPIPCTRCDVMSVDRHHYKLHMKTHEEDRYQCSKCDYTSGNFHALQSHNVVVHGSEKCFVCEICKEEYKTKHGLRCHMKSKHDPEFKKQKPVKKIKEHECNVCSKRFYFASNLVKHYLDSHGIIMENPNKKSPREKPSTSLNVIRMDHQFKTENEAAGTDFGAEDVVKVTMKEEEETWEESEMEDQIEHDELEGSVEGVYFEEIEMAVDPNQETTTVYVYEDSEVQDDGNQSENAEYEYLEEEFV